MRPKYFMQITYEIDADILVIRQNGTTDTSEIQKMMSTALKDPLLTKGSHLLWDARDAPANASTNKMKSLLHIPGSSAGILSGNIAMLVTSDRQYGVARIFSVYAEEAGVTVKVLHNEQEAKDWLRHR